jgi:hypothetical protein
LAEQTRKGFDRTETKEEVDNQVTYAQSELRNTYSYRLSKLNSVVNYHNLEGSESVTTLRNKMDREYEAFSTQIVQYSDNRKAELDKEAANRALNVLTEAENRVSTAG